MCRGHILNALSDRLYDLYTVEPCAKAIWNALEFKYQAKEEGTKKFLISKYFDYKFVDDKPILAQVHELQVIVNQLKAKKIELPEPFRVGAIIAKLPSSWKGYRKKILHDSKNITLEKIQKHLRIEEESRMRDKSENYFSNIKANIVKQPKNSNKGKQNKENHLGPKRDQGKFKKPKSGGCFVCGKPGHFVRYYEFKKGQKSKVNSVEGDDNIIATVSEVNAIFGKIFGWWYDTCATVHVCYDKTLFKTYREVTDGQEIQMGNEVRSKVIGKGNVELIFTSGKKVTLTNVLHVLGMSRNLVSGNLLGEPGIKSVFESRKLILSRNGTFVGKGYSTEGMVKLSIVDNDSEFNKNVAFVYIVDSCSLWHDRLAHIRTSTIKRMIKCSLINYHFNDLHKCKICVKSKMMKKPFKSIERHTNLLDLIHSDICELNGMLTRGDNRYFITFIDDMSRFTYVYLLKHKNGAFNAFKAYKAEVENQLGKKIKVLRSDRGGEYFSSEFNMFCEQHGIIHECSAPRTPEQNGLAERKNRTYLEMINAMLLYAKLSYNLWGEALLAACHISNRISSKKNKISPYELWK
ncbi:Retrotransposon protein [Musa troglodytarum]|uniref:Retrotransposon protein n=1 Tax=Musa troglodytarum TaxID=320322 RepID=A0A9E7I630_9LILI|nr:Retrotransposon protein [Musa troglodytarum]